MSDHPLDALRSLSKLSFLSYFTVVENVHGWMTDCLCATSEKFGCINLSHRALSPLDPSRNSPVCYMRGQDHSARDDVPAMKQDMMDVSGNPREIRKTMESRD